MNIKNVLDSSKFNNQHSNLLILTSISYDFSNLSSLSASISLSLSRTATFALSTASTEPEICKYEHLKTYTPQLCSQNSTLDV